MSAQFDIRICEGFGPLKFGDAMLEVRRHFGACEEEELMEDTADDSQMVVWHYWNSGFSFFFDLNQDKKLNCIETNHPSVTLFGQQLFALNENAVKALLRQKGYSLADEELHEWGEKRISFDDAAIDFYFERGKLTSVNFGIIPGAAPDTFLSP